MPVFRVHKTENYTVMSNHHLRDVGLSLQAKGLLSVILSLPPDWNYSIHGLALISKEGDKAIKSTLDELKDHGYLVVHRINPKQGSNRVRYEYDVYEKPLEPTKPQVAEPYPSEGVHREGVQGEGVPEGGQLNKEGLSTDSLSTDHSSNSSSEAKREAIKVIISYLNERTGKRFRSVESTRRLIRARLNEGYTVDDFKRVIDVKCSQWLNDRNMNKYLRPSTLFGTKFENYANEEVSGTQASMRSELDAYMSGWHEEKWGGDSGDAQVNP